MMKAFPIEYRLRYLVHTVIYMLGFYAPWERYTAISLGSSTWWLFLASLPARQHWLSFNASSIILLVLGCVASALGAALRVWGASYLGAAVVHSENMHGNQILADGPFRHTRNPLYLGTFLNTLALSLLMPPTGAIVCIILIAVVQIRLVGAEEPFLLKKLREPYALYCAAVPRFLPSLRPRVPSAGARPSYRTGFISELFVIGCAVSFIALGWNFNYTLLIKGVVVSFGLSIIARAFIPKALDASSNTVSEQ